jgi:hypothetical protein
VFQGSSRIDSRFSCNRWPAKTYLLQTRGERTDLTPSHQRDSPMASWCKQGRVWEGGSAGGVGAVRVWFAIDCTGRAAYRGSRPLWSTVVTLRWCHSLQRQSPEPTSHPLEYQFTPPTIARHAFFLLKSTKSREGRHSTLHSYHTWLWITEVGDDTACGRLRLHLASHCQ